MKIEENGFFFSKSNSSFRGNSGIPVVLIKKPINDSDSIYVILYARYFGILVAFID